MHIQTKIEITKKLVPTGVVLNYEFFIHIIHSGYFIKAYNISHGLTLVTWCHPFSSGFHGEWERTLPAQVSAHQMRNFILYGNATSACYAYSCYINYKAIYKYNYSLCNYSCLNYVIS